MSQDLFAPDKSDDPSTKQLAPFESFREQFDKLKTTAETLTVVSADDAAGMKLARLTRLSLKDVRVAIEHRRKELGEFHLRETQRINRDAKTLREIIEPLEARMLECEQFAEREAERLLDERHDARMKELAPFVVGIELDFDVRTLTDEQFAALMVHSKAGHEATLKAKADAEAKAKAEEAARIQMREENARLKKEADEREAKAMAEAKKAADALAKVKADAEAKAKAAKAKADAEAKKLRDEAAAAAAELKRIADAKAKEEADRIAAEEHAAAAPDKAKLAAFAVTLRDLTVPEMKTKAGKDTAKQLGEKVEWLAAWIESRI